MKHYQLAVALLILSFVSQAQQNKKGSMSPSTSNQKRLQPKATSKPEIDKLFDKYKDMESITLYTSYGDLPGIISKEYNVDDKPVSITINGNSDSREAVAEFLLNTIKMKVKQGYKVVKSSTMSLTVEEIEISLGSRFKESNSFQILMKKGSMYFRADGGCCKESIIQLGLLSRNSYSSGYTWEIETGDNNRKGGKKSENFDF